MTRAAGKLATYADVLAAGSDERVEVIGGQLQASPSPLPRHAKTQRALGSFIGQPFDDDDGRGGPGGWWILPEVDVQLDEHDVVRPDLAGWRRERLPDPWDTRPIVVRPDWICEVVSPSNAAHDRVTKRRLYARCGIPFYWLADPSQRTLEALKNVNGQWVELGSWTDADLARIEPFTAVELEVGRLFPPLAGG